MRLQLILNLEILVKQLWQVGVAEVYIDGSNDPHKEAGLHLNKFPDFFF